jgi:hypothetical protein
LLLVLFLVACVGLIAAAAIKYAGTSLSASAVYETQRATRADAEAAIRTAMQYVKANEQTGGTLATDGTTCPTNFSYPGSTGTVTVAMCPQPGSLTYAGYFRATLLTLAPSGFGITQTKNNTLNVNGNVWSNSYIQVRGLNVTGDVSAWNDSALGGNCASGSVVVSGTKDCNAHATYSNVVPKAGIDPGDPSLGHAADWAPAAAPGVSRTPTSCNLVPGVYTSGNALTNACPGSNSTINLAAGVYYLNFPSSDNTWSIFGTLQGPTCASSTDPGVQLVLANNAQIANYGTISIPCGSRATSTGPRIAIIGLKNTSGSVLAQTGCVIHGVCDAIRSGSNSGHDSLVVNDSVYIPQSTFSTTCKTGCSFSINQSLVAWGVDLDTNPSASQVIVGAGVTEIQPGNVFFQASIAGIDRTDADVTYDPTTYTPSISTWVIH